MNLFHNFGFLYPLQTLEEFNSGHFFDGQSSIETIWLILSQLDVDSIKDEELEQISLYWCETVITAKIYNFTKKPKATKNLFLSYCLLPQVAFSLYNRLLKKYETTQNPDLKDYVYDPIMAVIGFLENIFEEIDTPSNYPIKFLPIFNNTNPVIEFFKQHSDLPSINIIINWGLRFLFASTFYQNENSNGVNIQHFNEIKNLIDPNEEFFFDVKAELDKQAESNDENSNNNNQNTFDRFAKINTEIPLVSVLFLRYSLTKFFNIQITYPIVAPNANFYENFYNNVILNSNNNQGQSEQERIISEEQLINLSQTFLYVSGNKTQLPTNLLTSNSIPPEFITLSFLSETIDESKIDIYKSFERQPTSQNAVLFLFDKLKTTEEIDKFTEFLNSHQFTDGWINEARGCLLNFEPIDTLINNSLTGDVAAARALLDHPECKESLTPERSNLHKILLILFSNEPLPLPTEFPRFPKPEPVKEDDDSKSEANTQTGPNTTTEENKQIEPNTTTEENIQTEPNTTSELSIQTDSIINIDSNETLITADSKQNEECRKISDLYTANAAIIYKAIQFNYKLDFKPLISALHELLFDTLDSITKKRVLTYLILAGFEPKSHTNNSYFTIPHDAKDLIIDFTDDHLSLIFLNIYMILLYIEHSKNKNTLDEESLKLFADFCSNYYFSPYFYQIAKRSLPISFYNIISQNQSSYVIDSLKDKELRSQTLEMILPTIKSNSVSEALNIAKFFIDDGDIKLYIVLLSSCLSFVREIVSICPLDIQETIFNDFIEKGDQTKIKQIVPAILETNPSLFKRLGEIAMKTPKLLDSLLSVCNFTNENFIESVSSFSGEITTDFAQMLKKLVHSFPIYTITHEFKEGDEGMKRMNIKWSDEKSESSSYIDPWEFDEDKISQIKDHNKGKYPCFFCYTCGIFGERSPICLNCALKCHRGHDLVYYGLIETPCTCGKNSGSKCKIDNPVTEEKEKENKNNEKTKTTTKSTTSTTSNLTSIKNEKNKNVTKYFDSNNKHSTALLINLFKSLINSKLMKPPDPLQIIRLTTGSILDVDLTKFKATSVQPRMKFASIQSGESTGTHAASGNDGTESLPLSALPKLIDPQTIINEIRNQSSTYERHFEYRSIAFPMFAAAIGGPFCNILVVASGRTLTSFNIETMQQLSTFRMSNPGFQVSFCPLDPSVFAVASLKHVMIFSITEDGSFNESEQIMLLLEELSPTIFVNSVVWVPLEALHLAVVCNMFIKIYDIPTDRFSPIACFFADEPNFFSSAVFVEHEEECYGLFAMSTGRIAIQNTNVDPSDGPIPLTRFAPFPRFSSHQLTLSYSVESDILFISSPPQPLVAMRLDEFFKEKDPQFLSIDLPSPLNSLHMFFVHCVNESLHFMVNPFSGAVFALEFIDNEVVEVSSLMSTMSIPMSGFPLYDRSILTLTTFVMNEKLYAIGKNGKILTLQSADDSNDDDDEEIDKENEDEIDNENDDTVNKNDENRSIHSQFIVPASFWTEAKVAQKFLVEISARNVQGDPSIILSGGGFVFPGELRHKYLDVSLKDDNKLIVGFIFTVGFNNSSQRNRPSYFKVFNRRYNTICTNSSSRRICVPLRKEEVRARRRYRIQVGNNAMNEGNDIFIDSMDVLTIDADKLDPKYSWMRLSKEIDWFKDGENVFDFNDSRQIIKRSKEIVIRKENENQNINEENRKRLFRNPRIFKKKIKLGGDVLSYLINNVSLAFPFEFNMDDDTLKELIHIMYSNPDIAIAARRMIIKGAKLFGDDSKRKNEVLKIWADAICNLAKNGLINDKQWGLLWRDVALMPQELKDSITPIVWKSKPQLSGTFTALTAFLTK